MLYLFWLCLRIICISIQDAHIEFYLLNNILIYLSIKLKNFRNVKSRET